MLDLLLLAWRCCWHYRFRSVAARATAVIRTGLLLLLLCASAGTTSAIGGQFALFFVAFFRATLLISIVLPLHHILLDRLLGCSGC